METNVAQQIPDPLQVFSLGVDAFARLPELDMLAAQFRQKKASDDLPANTMAALRIELTYHSNAIEGNTLSLRETQLVLEGKSPAGEKSLREIYEARNHDRALRLIEKWADDRRAHPLSATDLLDVHAQVLADIDPSSAGRFRGGRVLFAGTGNVPPTSPKFDVVIPRLCDLAKRSGGHPVIRAAELHYNLAAVHPFNDGNGRTARLMMNYLLLRNDYPYAIIDVARRGEYLTALDEANHGRYKPFVELIIESTLTSANKILG